jgi:hypothetical protein
VIEVLSLYGTAKTTRAKLRSTTTYSTLKIFIVNSSRAIFSDSEISCGPHCTSFHSGRDIQFSFPKQRRLCHESPSAQLSASLRVPHFVPPLRVCIRAPTRGPMSLRGKHCFKNRRLTVKGPPQCYCVAGKRIRGWLYSQTQIVERSNVTMRDFC